jgi:hypothetical protein
MQATLLDVEHAFRQLEFAIKLNCFCEKKHLDKDQFDTDVLILLEEQNIGFAEGGFRSYDEIIMASQINIGICFGVSATVLDAAFEEAGINRNPGSQDPNDALRTLVYMVRCAFAHNFANPRWNVRRQYAHVITLNLENELLTVDLANLNELEFDYCHIGGFANWYKIRGMAVRMIENA